MFLFESKDNGRRPDLCYITFHSEIKRENKKNISMWENYTLCDLVSPKEIYV